MKTKRSALNDFSQRNCLVRAIPLLLLTLSLSCSHKSGIEMPDPTPPFTTSYKIEDLNISQAFPLNPVARGSTELKEVSGIAFSQKNPGFVWAHQDSGDGAYLYLLDEQTGSTVATYALPGVTNRDWEDMEIGPGPQGGTPYLYIAETGDNDQKYGTYVVYRLEEPKFEESHRGTIVAIDLGIDELSFKYPGKNHDVECLLVDPRSKSIFLVTKRDRFSKLYEMAFPQSTAGQNELTEIGSFSFNFATGGSVSHDGSGIAIKTYDHILYWKRGPSQSFRDAMASQPIRLPYFKERQGEAFCFHPNGSYFTLSEKGTGADPALYFYSKKE